MFALTLTLKPLPMPKELGECMGLYGITILPDPMRRSRAIPIPQLMRIQGNNTNFLIIRSRVSFSSDRAVAPAFPRLVLGPQTILQPVFVIPSVLAGAEEDTLTVTVTTDTEVVSGTTQIEMLSDILDMQ